MADPTYQPKVYRKQGGDELVVADDGLITVESGGKIMIGAVELTIAGAAIGDITATAAELNKLDGVGAVVASGATHAHVADIADAASGAQIATAVNAILAALEAFKVNAAA